MSIICIITARGGSKRIPKKNIKDFMGKPMLSYAINAAKGSKIFDEIMVSTDDNEIAQIAKEYGASVPFMRSEKTSSDYATTFDVIDEVINEYKKLGKNFDIICCIYPCVPFLKSETLINAYKKMGDHDGLAPVCKFPVPIEWALEITDNGILKILDREKCNTRSQDLIPKYYDVGMFYFCKTEKLYEHNSLAPDDTMAYVIDELECQDIDNEEDWQTAEMKYKILHNRG